LSLRLLLRHLHQHPRHPRQRFHRKVELCFHLPVLNHRESRLLQAAADH
jgi:hypothetical protein